VFCTWVHQVVLQGMRQPILACRLSTRCLHITVKNNISQKATETQLEKKKKKRLLIDALTASCCVVPALLAPLLPQIYVCFVSDSSDHKDDVYSFLQVSSSAVAAVSAACTTAKHAQFDTTMLLLKGCCKLSNACSISEHSRASTTKCRTAG